MSLNVDLNVSRLVVMILPLAVGVICHEVAHGWVADKLGDPTARLMGRISLNPLVHIDLFGTIVLPLLLFLFNAPFLFGWAKPVPVRMDLLRGGRRAMAQVALAGPLTNLMLAALSSCFYHSAVWALERGLILSLPHALWVVKPLIMMAGTSVMINLALMLINLVPIPPLDGGRIVMGIVPERVASSMARIERYGMLIIILLIASDLWSLTLAPLLNYLLRFFLW